MTSRDFVYWLQGWFELTHVGELDHVQVDQIKKHLKMVFIHEIDPSYGDKEHIEKLQKAHNVPPSGVPSMPNDLKIRC